MYVQRVSDPPQKVSGPKDAGEYKPVGDSRLRDKTEY